MNGFLVFIVIAMVYASILLAIEHQRFETKNKEPEKLKPKSDSGLFLLSVITPFTESEINEFMILTGYHDEELKLILINLCKAGISNLCSVNILIKTGCIIDFNYFLNNR